MIEALLSTALLASGFVIARAAGVRGPLLAILAVPVGLAVFVGASLVQSVIPLVPDWPLLSLALSGLIAIVVLIVDARTASIIRDWQYLVIALGAVALVALMYQVFPVTNWSTDSLYYLEYSRLLASNLLDVGFLGELEKRQLAVPAIHALAIQTSGDDVFRTLGPLMALSLAGLVWWFLRSRLVEKLGRQADLVALAAALSLVTFNRFVFHAFYVNSHMIFAVVLAAMVGLLWARAADFTLGASSTAAIVVPAVMVPSLVVARPEGALVAIIVAAAVVAGDSGRAASVFAFVVGVSTVVWNARLVGGALAIEQQPATSATLMLVLGAVVMALAAVVPVLSRKLRELAPWMLEAVLWLALAALAVREPKVLIESVAATGANLILGEGGWGLSVIVLIVAGVVALLLFRGDNDLVLRLTVTAFIPLALVLAYLREAAYRVGDGDSLNRMWMHILAVCIIFTVQRVITGRSRSRLVQAEPEPGAGAVA